MLRNYLKQAVILITPRGLMFGRARINLVNRFIHAITLAHFLGFRRFKLLKLQIPIMKFVFHLFWVANLFHGRREMKYCYRAFFTYRNIYIAFCFHRLYSYKLKRR